MKKMRYIILGTIVALASACSSVSTTSASEQCEDKLEILNLVMLFDEHVEDQAKDLVEMSKNKVADIHMIESITTNKASGGDGIPVGLFQILG